LAARLEAVADLYNPVEVWQGSERTLRWNSGLASPKERGTEHLS